MKTLAEEILELERNRSTTKSIHSTVCIDLSTSGHSKEDYTYLKKQKESLEKEYEEMGSLLKEKINSASDTDLARVLLLREIR